jgi:hypothetical protein
MIALWSCRKGELLTNQPPSTKIVVEEINLTGENRLTTTVRLSWYGTDPDGYVVGYELSINEGDWFFTEKQDSVFQFNLQDASDTSDILFQVRAIDNEDLKDPSPARLIVPIRNSPPVASFQEVVLPLDTTHLVYTFRYNALDPDGNETLRKSFIRVNDGDWYQVPLQERMISIVPEKPKENGVGDGLVYLGVNTNPETLRIKGLINNGENIFQVKVEDVAGAQSDIDSTPVIFIKPQIGDLLVISGQPVHVTQSYQNIINQVYPSADYIYYQLNNGKYQPKLWNPTFYLMSRHYDKIFIHTDASTFSNNVTSITNTILNFASGSMQRLLDDNKKIFVTTRFTRTTDFEAISPIFGIDSFTSSRGQAILSNDSIVKAQVAPFQDIQSSLFVLGASPFYPAFNTEILYRAPFTKTQGWVGPDVIGVARKNSENKTNVVFFSMELYLMDKNPLSLNHLFNTVLNERFNW